MKHKLESRLPGPSVRNPAHGKGHEEETRQAKASRISREPPWTYSSIYPKTGICLPYYIMPFTNSQSLLKLVSIESVMPSNHLMLCCPLLPPSVFLVGSPCSPRDSQESSPTAHFKSINSLALSFLHSPTLTSIHDHWKNHSLD